MSRRKQKFPFHLTGDDCETSQAELGNLNLHPEKTVFQHKHTMDSKEVTMGQAALTDEGAGCHALVNSPVGNSSPRNVSPSPSEDSVCSPKLTGNRRNNPEDQSSWPNDTVRDGSCVPEEVADRKQKLKCHACQLKFECPMSFRSHPCGHCQDSTFGGRLKREAEVMESNSAKKTRTSGDLPSNIKITRDCQSDPETYLPLDLSCRRMMGKIEDRLSSCKRKRPTEPFPESGTKMSVEEENLLNEAREHEKSFFSSNNELYLTEDSSGFDAPPLLPMCQSSGSTRQVTVCGDEGSPMVYKIKIHSEQMLVSRILGVNLETGNKIELYKCFLCGFSFPSISRLQAHLLYHKQKFVCRMCNYSCDTRAIFAHHVQKQHLVKFENKNRQVDQSEDSVNAENTVTVAALLSALRDKGGDSCNKSEGTPNTYAELEEDRKSESVSPISPSSESQESLENREHNGEPYKGYSCRFCNKKFDRAFSCNRHERVHTGFKPCYCNFCGRGFSEPRNLRHHVIRFHSDGSLRHLIKRDRRRRLGEEFCGSALSPIPLLKTALQSSPDRELSNFVNTMDSVQFSLNSGFDNNQDQKPLGVENNTNFRQSSIANYTKSLSKMLATSFDNKAKNRVIDGAGRNGDAYRNHNGENNNDLEPGEIRFKIGTKVVDDGERGRRLVMSEDNSDDVMEHSPQFSSYAPRLHIVQDRINREKALAPILDDIGRTFYECPYCRKLFGSTSDLNRHLDFHEDLRPYDCDYCTYSARTNSQLKVHKMRHEGIKQYTCDVCNYNGVTQSDLNRHKKTQSHTARSQNICSVCGLGFYSHSQKQVHIVQCHPEMEGASSLIQMSLGVPLACKESSESSRSPTELTALPN